MTDQERRRLKRMLLSLKWMVFKSMVKHYAELILIVTLCIIAVVILIYVLLVSIIIAYTLDICVSIVTLHKHRDARDLCARMWRRLSEWYKTKFYDEGSE